jgi:putative oxygen-independent coproporphyrinogen III oxidase
MTGHNATANTASSQDLPPLALYVHFPWCVAKCPYCDFNSHALRDALPESAYLDALVADMQIQAPRATGRAISSVFMGGGTPSLFSPAAIGGLLESLQKILPFEPDAEITLEANPATVERGRFGEYHAAGINRVSLGAQSFDSETLKALGRIHQPADVFRAAEELHASGLSNFNLDLMFALPQQDIAGALADLACALQLEPAHLSHYQLTLEPGTLFAAQPPPLPDEDIAWDMQGACHAVLEARGFIQYEVSAFARAGRQCRHNLNYWQFGDYLGIGAGAHGKLTRASAADGRAVLIERSTHLREPRRYFASAAQGPAWKAVPDEDLPFEFAMNALRLNEGFEPDLFTRRTGLGFSRIQGVLQVLQEQGLIESAGHWRATARGRQLLNELIQRFLPGRNSEAVARS